MPLFFYPCQTEQLSLSTLEELAYASDNDLTHALQVASPEIESIRDQANNLLLAKAFASESEHLNPSDEEPSLSDLQGMTAELLTTLNRHHIDSQESLAELSIDDLLEIAPLSREAAGQLIKGNRLCGL